jgi:hypothetical protein
VLWFNSTHFCCPENVILGVMLFFDLSLTGLAGIIRQQRSCNILPYNGEERQDAAAATNRAHE